MEDEEQDLKEQVEEEEEKCKKWKTKEIIIESMSKVGCEYTKRANGGGGEGER